MWNKGNKNFDHVIMQQIWANIFLNIAQIAFCECNFFLSELHKTVFTWPKWQPLEMCKLQHSLTTISFVAVSCCRGMNSYLIPTESFSCSWKSYIFIQSNCTNSNSAKHICLEALHNVGYTTRNDETLLTKSCSKLVCFLEDQLIWFWLCPKMNSACILFLQTLVHMHIWTVWGHLPNCIIRSSKWSGLHFSNHCERPLVPMVLLTVGFIGTNGSNVCLGLIGSNRSIIYLL